MNKRTTIQGENALEVPAMEQPICGIVMPISAMDDYDADHWHRVRVILDRAIETAGFKPKMVSESEEIRVIQESIVQNLYDNDIVVVDVSGKNPNVMFELGLRLAFDKPTIIIKDDSTTYNFDTSPIKHINYRRDLRFDDVEQLQGKVTAAIKATLAKKDADSDYSPFLKTFGRIKVTGLETKEVDSSEFIVSQLQMLHKEINRLSSAVTVLSDTSQLSFPASPDLEKIISKLIVDGQHDLTTPTGLERFSAHLRNELKKRKITVSDDTVAHVLNSSPLFRTPMGDWRS